MGFRASDENPPTQLGLHQLPGKLLTTDDLESERWYLSMPEWPGPSGNNLPGTKDQWILVAQEALSSSSRMFDSRTATSAAESVRRVLGKQSALGDKIAAYAIAVQECPLFRVNELHELLSFTKCKVRGARTQAIDALKELLISDLLPDGRLLLSIDERNFNCDKRELTKRHLTYALFESELKNAYAEFVGILEDCTRDSVSFTKKKALKAVLDLLVAKPENEKKLLAILVNKLGDPDRKTSADASNHLTLLIEKHHPQMRVVVVREVEHMLFRSNVTRKAQYYAVCFLNQVKYEKEDVELARDVVRIYMDIFTACLTDDTAKDRDAAAKEEKRKADKAKQRKRNGKKKMKKEKEKPYVSEVTKNSRLMSALLVGVNRAFPYTKPEEDDTSYEKYFDSLFCVAHAESFSSATQALSFLLQVSHSSSVQSDRLYRALYERILDASDNSDKTQAAFLNVVFKAMKSDTNTRRVKAYTKRLIQAGMHGSAAFAGSCVMVVSEFLKHSEKGILKSFLSLPEKDDDDEVFFDADKLELPDDEEPEFQGAEEKADGDDTKNDATTASARTAPDTNPPRESEKYDPGKRDPMYAGAEKSSLWEAVGMCAHFHPSVAMHSKALCQNESSIESPGDPLRDYSLIAFLDRFCYRRAKNRIAKSLYGKRSSRYRNDPVADSTAFQELAKEGKVDEDDKFLAKFFEKNPNRIRQDMLTESVRHGSDVDSEEEAFELAVQEEMKRLGAAQGLLNPGMFGHDIEEEQEDVVEAFDEAFEKDMADSDDGGGAEEDVTELPGKVQSRGGEFDSEDGSDLEGLTSQGTETGAQKGMGSVFADASSYQQAIDEELKLAAEAAAAEADGCDREDEFQPMLQEAPSKKRRKKTHNDGRAGKKGNKKRRKQGTSEKRVTFAE